MPLRPILLITCLAPMSAAAFGDLDCVTTGVIEGDTFRPDAISFSVTFDWPAEQATVTVQGERPRTLDIYDMAQTDAVSELRYALGDSYALTVTAAGAGIDATYGDNVLGLGYVARCDRKQAA